MALEYFFHYSLNWVIFACHRRDLLAKIIITSFLLVSFELLQPFWKYVSLQETKIIVWRSSRA